MAPERFLPPRLFPQSRLLEANRERCEVANVAPQRSPRIYQYDNGEETCTYLYPPLATRQATGFGPPLNLLLVPTPPTLSCHPLLHQAAMGIAACPSRALRMMLCP